MRCLRPHWDILLCAALWGAFFPAGKYVLSALPPMAAAALRFWLAGAVLLVLLAWREPRAFRLARRDWPLVLGLGLSGIAAYNALAFLGFERAPSIDGAAISPTLNPVLTAMLAAWLFGERVTPARKLGMALALLGIGLLFLRPALEAGGGLSRLGGDALFVASALAWSAYTLLGKLAAQRFSPLASTTYASVAGALMLTPLAWGDLARLSPGQWSLPIWASLLFLALGCTVLAFVLWYRAIARLGPAGAASFLPLVPTTGVLAGVLALGERLDALQAFGMALAVGGVALANRSQVPPPARR